MVNHLPKSQIYHSTPLLYLSHPISVIFSAQKIISTLQIAAFNAQKKRTRKLEDAHAILHGKTEPHILVIILELFVLQVN